MNIAPEFYQPYRAQLLAELEKKLGLEQTLLPRLAWATLWLADLDRLQELIDEPDTDSTKAMLLRPQNITAVPDDEALRPSWLLGERCLDRERNRCFITKAREPLEAVCIIQIPVGEHRASFWKVASYCFSKYRVNAWKRAVKEGETEECVNIISMAPSVAAYWREELFALKPIELSADKKSMKVQFFWLPLSPCVKKCMTTRPDLPEDLSTPGDDIKLWDCKTEEKIVSGQTVILTTNNPAKRPLPSWHLLEMIWFINRAAAVAGLTGYQCDDELEYDKDIEDESHTIGRSSSCDSHDTGVSHDN